MLQTVVRPNISQALHHSFGNGATVWGHAITPSIAHMLQGHRELGIRYSEIRPGPVFEICDGVALLPHVIDASTLRLHAEASAFRRVTNQSESAVEAVVRCAIGDACNLKLWGCISAENTSRTSEAASRDMTITLPVIFDVAFWEISPMKAPGKERESQELRARVALSTCSQ